MAKYPKLVEASHKRWASFLEPTRIAMAAKKSKAMREWWATLSTEEQKAIIRRRAQGMRDASAKRRAQKEASRENQSESQPV